MFRILDRYLLRELATPFVLALLLLTFALEIPPILQHGETLIAEGASWDVVIRVLATLVPQALGITIPMALLCGILFALGRLSADREIVAMEACGISLGRLLRPLIFFAVLATAATTYVMIVALPAANQAFREITFRLLMSRGESKIKPRVFYDGFPNLVIYVREVTPGVGWSNVVVAETSQANEHKLYLAKRGRLAIDEGKRSVTLVLEDGTQHSVNIREPEKYVLAKFEDTSLSIDPETVFPREGPMKGYTEMTIAELKEEMVEFKAQNLYPHNQIMAWQKKYSIPAACLAFMLVALGLGATNKREGNLASFVVGTGVVFVYWVLMYMSEAIAKAGLLPYWFAWIAMWVPNVVVGIWGLTLIVRKLRTPDQSIQFAVPFFKRVRGMSQKDGAPAARGTRVVVVIRVPQLSLPSLSILDWYVLKQGLWISALSAVALLALFYIATFIDLSDHLFKGRTTAFVVLQYLWFASPQFLYYLVPLAVLMGALVTIGALTKNSELVVMKACGISLYRAAAPLLILAIVGSAVLIGLEEGVLAYSNRRADAINNAIRGRLPTAQSLDRRWVAGNNGNLYQYVYFEPGRNRLNGLAIYEFGGDPSSLARRRYFEYAQFRGDREARGQVQWQGVGGWQREFQAKSKMSFAMFTDQSVVMEGPGYFASERPDAEHMSYRQLSAHVDALHAGGFNVIPYVVALHRKLAFPFVTLIMALIAVPFAVTTGKRGAMYGVGAGIVLAILYWTAISVFGAIGAGGLMAPALAAWAPNIIFGCAAMYLLLTVRT